MKAKYGSNCVRRGLAATFGHQFRQVLAQHNKFYVWTGTGHLATTIYIWAGTGPLAPTVYVWAETGPLAPTV